MTFNQVAGELPFVKVFWNGELVWDDTVVVDKPLYHLNNYGKFIETYGNQEVDCATILTCEGHHCEVHIQSKFENMHK